MSVTIKLAPPAQDTTSPVDGTKPAPEGIALPPAPAVKTFSRAEPPGAGPRAPRKSGKPKEKTKPRRPHQYDPAVIDAVLKAVAGGKTLTEACRSDPAFPTRSAVYGWISADPELKARYDTAREFQLEFWADQLIDIPDAIQIGDYMGKLPDGTVVKLKTADKIKKASLQVEYRFKVLSRRSQDYTERQTITHAGKIDGTKTIVVTGALPRVPLGELPPEERAAAVALAAETRVITREQITNPFGIDVNAIEAEDARMEAEDEAEIEAAARGPSPGDLAVLARVSNAPEDYDGDA
ncbi:hypothetical protein [Caballeronia sp. LjRoot31]|uniref:terminase small subunit-like protein n=1 Tax=Caballeronia sp. LjRoot31 TaxID=3342324 RepID=UPI003ECD33B7